MSFIAVPKSCAEAQKGTQTQTHTHTHYQILLFLFFVLLLRQRSHLFWWVINLRQAFGKERKDLVGLFRNKQKQSIRNWLDFLTHLLHLYLLQTSFLAKSFHEASGISIILCFVFFKFKCKLF